MDGGETEVRCDLILRGIEVDTGMSTGVVCPSTFFEVDVNVDVILSYESLALMGIDIRCQQHGLTIRRPSVLIGVAGINFARANGPLP